jgi:hypothetical protein
MLQPKRTKYRKYQKGETGGKVSNTSSLSFGKFGIKKALIVGRERGRSKKETIDYIAENINNIRFYTKVGKKLGNKDIKITKNFIKKYLK